MKRNHQWNANQSTAAAAAAAAGDVTICKIEQCRTPNKCNNFQHLVECDEHNQNSMRKNWNVGKGPGDS